MKVVRGRVSGEVVEQVSEGKGGEEDGQASDDVENSHSKSFAYGASLTQIIERCKRTTVKLRSSDSRGGCPHMVSAREHSPDLPAFTKFADASRIEVRFRKRPYKQIH